MVTAAELKRIGLDAGLVAVGVTGAEPFSEARAAIEDRKAAGLHAGMSFTFKNPARSTEPARLLPDTRSLVVGALAYAGGDLGAPPPDRPSGQVARYATADAVADELVMLALDGLPLTHTNDQLEQVRRLTVADLDTAWVSQVSGEWTIVVVGDAAVVRADIEALGRGAVTVVAN